MTEKNLKNGILNWYPWKEGAVIHFAGDCPKNLKQDILCRGVVEGSTPPFDYIVAVHILEESKNPVDMLRLLKGDLKAEGHLFLVCENRLGLQYFAGDRDPYTNRVMDGIENYPDMQTTQKEIKGRCYARYEIENFLKNAGFDFYRGYSVLPGLFMPQQIYGWEYLPQEDLQIRYTPLYNNADSVFMDTKKVYNSLVCNGMFHQMANAYLIDCSDTDQFFKVMYITTSMDRGRKNALATLICEDQQVYKFALYPEGNWRIKKLLENTKELENRNISVIPLFKKNMGKYEEKELMGCFMPYVKAPTAVQYLRGLIHQDKEKYIKKMTEYLDIILSSSSEVPGTKKEEISPLYKEAYTDLMPINSFYINDSFVFFDQEFCEKNYPIGVVLVRALDMIYWGDKQMEEIVPCSYFTTRYGLEQKKSLYGKMGDKYIKDLRNRESLMEYNSQHLADEMVIDKNRQKINYSVEEYQKKFMDLLCDTKEKRLFVFGSGLWAEKFMAQYADTICIEAMLDNNVEKQGRMVAGVEVKSPKILETLNPDGYKVFICMKQYSAVQQQLLDAGVKNYGIYNPNIERPFMTEIN